MAFDACQLSGGLKDAQVSDMSHTNKVIQKVQQSKFFKKINNIPKSTILTFSVASFNSLPGGVSQGGYLVFLTNNNGNICSIHWQSWKIKRTMRSSLEVKHPFTWKQS